MENPKDSPHNLRPAVPVLKWAGGKKQLLREIGARLPEELHKSGIQRYIEPFIGGGAVFFHLVQKYNLPEIILADINPELILLYQALQQDSERIIEHLLQMEAEYLNRNEMSRKLYYYQTRQDFNRRLIETNFERYSAGWALRAAQIIFLNRTGYNGLFRVNRKGEFNVPLGRYRNPKICDAANLRLVAGVLHRATIRCADFTAIEGYANDRTFVYFDPPYRPISQTASFDSYIKGGFGDAEQRRLAECYRRLDSKGVKLLLSNSDPHNTDPLDDFFDDLYSSFKIERVKATRLINSQALKRGPVNELLIRNYPLAHELPHARRERSEMHPSG